MLTVGGSGFNGTITASVNETRAYNNMLQLTRLTAIAGSFAGSNTITANVDMQYVYNTGHNNGRVAQTIDNTLGETVNYGYDYLHRLTAATATNGTWGESYTYDGFGNLTGKTPTQGYAPAMTGSADSNATGGALNGQWDVEKRPMTQGATQATPFYVYDPWGRRIWKQWYDTTYGTTNCEAYFYGATGQKLESYSCTYSATSLGATLQGINTYFAGKMLSEKGVFIATDRLGSVRGDSNGVSMSYYPWGEERGQGTADGRTKFAGYYRDAPGQDYANARYYSAGTGSFWSPDPGGMKAADSGSPTTWNRYGYAGGDPINFNDPTGRIQQFAGTDCFGIYDPNNDMQYLGVDCEALYTDVGIAPEGGVDQTGGGGGGPSIAIPTKAPPCAQNPALAGQALNNIVASVGQVLSASGFSQASINQIEGDLTANESAQGDVGFVGGHFNLLLTGTQIDDLNANGSTAGTDVTNLFVGGTDGSASGVLGLFGNGPRHNQSNGTSLHSQASGGGIDFHLDLRNPYNDIAGIVGHIGHDILPPRIGNKPCLDAPFTSAGGGH